MKILDTAPLIIPAVCLMAGIVLGHELHLSMVWLWLLVAVVGVACLLWKWRHLQTITIMVGVVLFGALLMNVNGHTSDDSDSMTGRSRHFFLSQREVLLQRFADAGLSDDQYAIVAAMVLGDKSALSRDIKNTYSMTGASHVLALSGLHLGIIYALLSLLVVGRRWQLFSQILIILSIWAFVFLVGMPASVVRAAVMLTVYALLALGHRPKMSVNTLAFTAVVMLLFQPSALFTISFQMSFMAVLSILLFVPLFEAVFTPEYLMTHRWVKWLWGMVAVSCAAQIGVAPLIAYYFGRFSVWFLLTNFIVIPAATLILYLSLLVLVIPQLAFLLVYVVGGLNSTLTKIAQLPGASIEGLHPTLTQTVLIYVVILALYVLLRLRLSRHPLRLSRR
jgi:competence protein ComEC